jgi:hypothetical protein
MDLHKKEVVVHEMSCLCCVNVEYSDFVDAVH